jgi:hypothetical protein
MQLAAQRAWSPFGGITSLLCKLAIFQHHQLSVAIVVTVRSYICGFPQGEAMADSGQRVLATLAGSRRPR